MGCGSSQPSNSNTKTLNPQTKHVNSVNNNENGDHHSNGNTSTNGNNSPSSPHNIISSPEDASINAEALAKQQRRRLSVAPKHVGDISGNQALKLIAAENSLLTPAEIAAKGSLISVIKTQKGMVPYNKNKVNQDRAIVKYGLLSEEKENNNGHRGSIDESSAVHVFGVCDGHGEFGHHVAQFVQEKLPVNLSHQGQLLLRDPPTAIHQAVKMVCEELTETNINVAFSGTTCVFGVKVANKLYSANIGDSRCIMIRLAEDGKSIQALPLSVDQKPENPTEKARIIAAGGRVEPLPGPPGEDCGPPRVWLAEVDVPGLAMSRSIGDEVSQTVGVTSVPEIIEHEITDKDIIAIWASDGVWEFLSNDEVASIVWRNRFDLNAAAQQLVEAATAQWKAQEEVIDDITTVILQLHLPPRS